MKRITQCNKIEYLWGRNKGELTRAGRVGWSGLSSTELREKPAMLSSDIQAEKIINSETLRQIKGWYVKKPQQRPCVAEQNEWVGKSNRRWNQRWKALWAMVRSLEFILWQVGTHQSWREVRTPDNLHFKETMHLTHKNLLYTILPLLSLFTEVPKALKNVRVTGHKVSGSLDNLTGVLVLARNTSVGLLRSKN